MNIHLVVLYDSIDNSVFYGQLFIPFCKKVEAKNEQGLILSFERSMQKPPPNYTHPRVTFCIKKQLPFIGSLSLRYAAYQLHTVLRDYEVQSVTARGPLAGWIVAHSNIPKNIPVIVQARGLAAQEYRYAHAKTKSFGKQLLHRMRMRQYDSIEQYVYGVFALEQHVSIHAVSNAITAIPSRNIWYTNRNNSS